MSNNEILGAGSLLKAPDSALIDETASEIIMVLDGEAYGFDYRTSPPRDEYIAQRRLFLGPIADITHPEFGRPNQPEETYAMTYRVQEVPRILTTVSEDGEKTHEQAFTHHVAEYVVDQNQDLIETVSAFAPNL